VGARAVIKLRDEAYHRRERLARYKGRMYGGRGASAFKLRELEGGCHRAEARLRRAQASRQVAAEPRQQ
jgi:hypothetical protein